MAEAAGDGPRHPRRVDVGRVELPTYVLVRRGVALARGESDLRRRALAQGFHPLGLQQALRLTERLAGLAPEGA